MGIGAVPDDFLGVALIVVLLGMRHGLDADHLAAIDGLTFHNHESRPGLARICGALFSLGHGSVVVCVALAVSLTTQSWHPPVWLETLGSWISVLVLGLLGAVNMAAALRAPAGSLARLKGWRSGVFARLLRAGSPLTVFAVGTLFALSLDTFSLAALFAMTATQFGGWHPAIVLGLLFTVGMMVTDGANGYWVSRLIRRSDRSAQVASRVMALAVAGVSLLTAAMVLATLLVPAADAWKQGKELWFGTGIVAVVLASFLIGKRLAADRSSSPD